MPGTIGIGMLGYAFMGRAHADAYARLSRLPEPPPALPRLVSVAGRTEESLRDAAARFGFERWTTDWSEVVADPDVGLFDNSGPNAVHAEAVIAAARAGKHVICEKPLARDADEALAMLEAVEDAGVKHMCAFNYRFVPA